MEATRKMSIELFRYISAPYDQDQKGNQADRVFRTRGQCFAKSAASNSKIALLTPQIIFMQPQGDDAYSVPTPPSLCW